MKNLSSVNLVSQPLHVSGMYIYSILPDDDDDDDDDDNNNNNNIYLLQLGCHPVAVVILHVNKT